LPQAVLPILSTSLDEVNGALKNIWHRKLFPLVGIVLLLGAGLSILGFARAAAKKPSPRVRPVAYTHLRLKKTLTSVPTDPRTAVADVLRDYGGRRVLSASVETRSARPAGGILHFVVAATDMGENVIRGQWESDLVAGAIADRLAGTPNQVVSTIIDVQLPDGEIHPDLGGGGMGNVAPNQAFSSSGESAIRASVTEQLAQSHLDLVSLDVLRAPQAAPAVVVMTDDPLAAAAAASETIRAIFGQNPPKYEGYYLEVRDSAGTPVLIQSAAFRTGAGRLWFAPKVADVISLQHAGGRKG
jgi:hypothetical protein